jgi:hypothetical protein
MVSCKAVPSSNFGSAPQRRPSTTERSALKNYETEQEQRKQFKLQKIMYGMCGKENDIIVELSNCRIIVDGINSTVWF